MVTVVVEEINNFKVFVLGEVTMQGVLTSAAPHAACSRRSRLAGGMSRSRTSRICCCCVSKTARKIRTRIDYRKVVSGEKPELNVYLRPGDTIIVN